MSPEVSDNRWWALEPAPGWVVVPPASAPQRAPLQEDDCVALVAPTRDAVLRVFAWDYSAQTFTPEQWVDGCTHLSSRRGWAPEPWASGGFAGAHARQLTEGVAWRLWWLAADKVALNALYRCPPEVAGRDDAALDTMLRKLRFRAAAG